MLEIRKPFDPSISEEEEKKIEENEENEEKPVEQPQQQNSEETHGGSESTESIQDSENPAETENEKQSSSENEPNNESKEDSEKEEAKSEKSVNEDQKGEASSEENSHESSESEGSTNNGQENAKDMDARGEANETAEFDSENNEDDSMEGNEGNQEYDEYEDQDDQPYSHIYNTEEVVIVDANKKPISAKYFATEFWRFIESFAEEKTKIYDNTEPEEYNVKKLMFRQYERKPLNAYMQKRVREAVILILDNSGSMEWWASNLKMLASLALEKGDVEVYIAPNGEIVAQLTKNGRVRISHDKFMKAMIGRKLIYIGDFDGGDTPIKLSWRNDVVWICPEERYRHFLSHDWVSYDESKFHGVFIRAFTIEEMFEGLRKITRLSRLFIDLHENQRYEDDSWS